MDHDDPIDVAVLPDKIARELVHMCKLFSDDTRVRIVHFLMQHDELNVRTMCELLGQSQPAVSHHLALLRVDGLIDCRRDGKHNYYRILSGRVRKFIETIFSASPNQPGRIGFGDFTLSYNPDSAPVDSAL